MIIDISPLKRYYKMIANSGDTKNPEFALTMRGSSLIFVFRSTYTQGEITLSYEWEGDESVEDFSPCLFQVGSFLPLVRSSDTVSLRGKSFFIPNVTASIVRPVSSVPTLPKVKQDSPYNVTTFVWDTVNEDNSAALVLIDKLVEDTRSRVMTSKSGAFVRPDSALVFDGDAVITLPSVFDITVDWSSHAIDVLRQLPEDVYQVRVEEMIGTRGIRMESSGFVFQASVFHYLPDSYAYEGICKEMQAMDTSNYVVVSREELSNLFAFMEMYVSDATKVQLTLIDDPSTPDELSIFLDGGKNGYIRRTVPLESRSFNREDTYTDAIDNRRIRRVLGIMNSNMIRISFVTENIKSGGVRTLLVIQEETEEPITAYIQTLL